MKIEELKTSLRKVWNFLWNDDSVLSWIVSLILAFIIIKFIFFPILSLIFGTALPLVVVESGSMHHPGGFLGNSIGSSSSFDMWWAEHSQWYLEQGINKEKFKSFSLRNGLEIGDIVVISGRVNYHLGDIIVFNGGQRYPIIHRIVNITEVNDELVYQTKGDNNNILGSEQFPFELNITKDKILGKALFRIPKIGWIKLFFTKLFSW